MYSLCVENQLDAFGRFDRMPVCDERTDRHRVLVSARYALALRMHRAVKTTFLSAHRVYMCAWREGGVGASAVRASKCVRRRRRRVRQFPDRGVSHPDQHVRGRHPQRAAS